MRILLTAIIALTLVASGGSGGGKKTDNGGSGGGGNGLAPERPFATITGKAVDALIVNGTLKVGIARVDLWRANPALKRLSKFK